MVVIWFNCVWYVDWLNRGIGVVVSGLDFLVVGCVFIRGGFVKKMLLG